VREDIKPRLRNNKMEIFQSNVRWISSRVRIPAKESPFEDNAEKIISLSNICFMDPITQSMI